ncbi:UDP-N-acetylmuramoyl-L-alanyl-D-glutamate--2,6-diaminopimelate ligase [Cohaesibacter gelatinilyticus]|uniref:UDP-N-acetylmuramoyl-L-alanyl-D-glutamate--2,6-diaminopimelate ligase n=1 Tax=Cohaesibacter gelatinilyticus TaxID=372072 RepID=A0A285NHX2_9HYPH|nr:UDP-N-acetylmuramoyl-L-alanyl-D-glutamate--2,6-diaminopimelate ligase [Cohaesibacter gelatinilyticus]SNZ09080.1 UDP-N-acetylmuramoylalanyl-D-glutamate--2,6-diaminopimelate ligase [Cohaesibacter gelatinilyticus]
MLLRDLFASLPLIQKQGDKACLDQKVAGLNADSRKIETDFLFIGVPGSQVDGARFLEQVIEKGALAAIISDASDIPAEGVPAEFPIFCCADVHGALATLAGAFYPISYEKIAAVTGTNGKTSIASFLRQIWASAGKRAANIGTIGVEGPNGASYGGLTTPDPVGLLQSVQRLEEEQGVTHLALEASSHGLEQKRLDGLKVDVGAYTNLTRDHLDYHKTFEAYRDAKLQLFTRLVRKDGTAVINLDDDHSSYFLDAAKARGLTCLTLGETTSADLRIKSISFDGEKQIVLLTGVWGNVEAHIPLVGTFQASNALVAGLMAYASGLSVGEILNALSQLKGACGRMELVGRTGQGAPIYVDYSHTPDSLETALKALRPFTKERLIVVIGAGGDRDPGKRPMMGKAANDYADFAIVTDDNPRSEDPALIRKAVMETVETGCEVAGRYDAIAKGVSMLQAGDILLVAGKGHEQGQTVKGEVLPFSDHEAVQQVLKEHNEGAAS